MAAVSLLPQAGAGGAGLDQRLSLGQKERCLWTAIILVVSIHVEYRRYRVRTGHQDSLHSGPEVRFLDIFSQLWPGLCFILLDAILTYPFSSQ